LIRFNSIDGLGVKSNVERVKEIIAATGIKEFYFFSLQYFPPKNQSLNEVWKT
jgi:hypothetical protein